MIFLTIIGMMAVTYLPRVMPLLTLAHKDLAPWLKKWLEMVPAAVLSSLLAPGLFWQGNQLNVCLHNPFIWGAIITLVLAKTSKNFILPILAGMCMVAGLRFWGV